MSVNVSTYHYSNAETGANTNETVLTQANVNSTTFGKVASMPVDGQIFGQPLVMTNVAVAGQGTHDIVLVATENDDVYAFDAYGNNPSQGYLWRTSLIGANETTVPESTYGTTDITPQLGVTGTPVIDQNTGTMYLVGLFYNTSAATYSQRLYALNISTGTNAIAPVTITANVSGSTFSNSTYVNTGGVVSFSAYRENQRPALTLANGEVYIGWSSHGDQDPWHGWVMGYNQTTLHQDYVYCDTLNGEEGGIWMSGGGLAVDSSGNIYFTTGNGSFDGTTNFSMAIEKLSPSLKLLDYFAPYNEASLSNGDLDYGCANVILLTNQPGADPNQVLTAGKWGTIYLNDSDTGQLGEFNSTTNDDLGQANITTNVSTSDVHQTMVYWNGYAYLAGDGLPLEAFSLSSFANGTITPFSSESGHDFGSTSIEDAQGGGLTVSSNGNANGILWALDNSAYNTSSATSYSASGPAVLYAYNANNLAQPLWSSASASGGRDTAGTAIKFQDPVVANGHVYIAGMNSVTVFGLLSTSTNVPTVATAATASPTTTTSSTNLSITATDVSGDSSPAYFWAASNSPSGATAPTFTANNSSSAAATTATFFKAGTYTLTCTVEDPTTGYTVLSSVNVTVTQTLTAVSVSPSLAVVANSGTQQFTASATDQFGNAMLSQPSFTWSVTPGGVGGTINSSGLYTAPTAGSGSDTITASAGSFSGSSTATVALPSTTYQLNLSTYYNHFGIAANGHRISGGGIDGDGDGLSGTLLGTSQSWNGSTFTISGTTTGNNTNNVVVGAAQTITITPGHYTALKILALHLNGSASETLTLDYSDGTTQAITQNFSDWYTPQNYAGESIALSMAYRIISNGNQGTGPFDLYGYNFAPNYSKTLTGITLPTDTYFDMVSMDTVGTLVPTITVAAAGNPTTVTGTTTVLSAGATDPSGDAAPIYTWSATNLPSGAVTPTFSVNGTTASNVSTATFLAAGAYTFTVTVKDPTTGATITSSVNVTVSQTFTSIAILPVSASVYDTRTQSFTATADDQFGAALSSQPSFTWSVNSGGAGGTINTSTGLYAAPASGSGTDTVKATSGTFTNTASVTVLAANPAVTTAASANPSPVTGTTTVLNVLGTDITGDASPIYTWATTNAPSGATTPTFSLNGTSTANSAATTFYKAGAYTFTVTIKDPTDGLSSTSSVNVTVNQTLTSISVAPAGPVPLTNGQTQQFAATGYDQFANVMSSQPTFTWSLGGSAIGSVSSTGLYQAPASGLGSTTVIASSGTFSGQATVQVNQPAWLGAGSGAVYNSSSHILTVTGAASIIADPGSDQPIIQANGSSAIVTINPASGLQIHIGGLSLSNGASATVSSLGAARTSTNHLVLVLGLPGASTAPLLTIDSTSQLDLNDNDLVDHDGSLSAVFGLLQSGYNAAGASWNGAGIASSNAAGGTLNALGETQPSVIGTFDNQSVSASDVEVRFTYYGDANLDGHVDGSDYSLIDNGFINHLTGWNNGDFNYDGVVDGSDYTLIDNAFNSQGASFDAALATPAAEIAASTSVASTSKTKVATPVPAGKTAPSGEAALPAPHLVLNASSFVGVASPLADQLPLSGSQPDGAIDPVLRHHVKKAGKGAGSNFSNVQILLETSQSI